MIPSNCFQALRKLVLTFKTNWNRWHRDKTSVTSLFKFLTPRSSVWNLNSFFLLQTREEVCRFHLSVNVWQPELITSGLYTAHSTFYKAFVSPVSVGSGTFGADGVVFLLWHIYMSCEYVPNALLPAVQGALVSPFPRHTFELGHAVRLKRIQATFSSQNNLRTLLMPQWGSNDTVTP